MKRYFFHVYDGQNILDHVGTELPSRHAVRLHMVGHALEMLDLMIRHDEPWQMDAVDEAGKIVATMDFGLEKPAAR